VALKRRACVSPGETGYVCTGSQVTLVDGGGVGQLREADLIAASWYQHNSRDGDVQLHHDNQIAHTTLRHDGKWRAPDSTAYTSMCARAGRSPPCTRGAALTPRFGHSSGAHARHRNGRADLIASLGRELPQRAGDPGQRAGP